MQLSPKLEDWRIRKGPYGSATGLPYGAFNIPGPCGRELHVMCGSSTLEESKGWEHVSVSLKTRTPNWQEMTFIKRLFWPDDAWVVEFHPPAAKNINLHPFTLHMWCWTRGVFPLPPEILV